MSKRSYEQVCALATALDILGDRWSLLIARELLFGARRYSDILRYLPGIGTNLLARRLKELEAAGFIERQKLPPPAGTTVYTLTSTGRQQLTPLIRALTEFGVIYLQYPPHPGYFVPASATMGALSKFFQREGAAGFSARVEFRLAEDIFHCAIENGELTMLGFGSLPAADLVVQGTTDAIMGLVVGYLEVATLLANDELTIIAGTPAQAVQFFAQFAGNFDDLA